jgi:hypothetical protein
LLLSLKGVAQVIRYAQQFESRLGASLCCAFSFLRLAFPFV